MDLGIIELPINFELAIASPRPLRSLALPSRSVARPTRT